MRIPLPRLAFLLTALAALAAAVWQARVLTYDPAGLPTWDSAMYLLEGVKVREALANVDPAGLMKRLTHPDLHPPLHAAALGGWLLVAGNTLEAARLYPFLAFVGALGMLVWLGRLAWGRDGVLVGLGAALITALSRGNLELVSTPMTESTGLLVQLGALAVFVVTAERRDARAQLAVGFAVLAATLVRYNLAPMLIAPLALDHAWRNRRDLRALVDPRLLLWVAPTAVLFVGWQLSRPELFGMIGKFLENRSSGIPFWSVENLLWVPIQTTKAYLGTWLLTVPLLGLFVAGMVPAARAPDAAPDRAGRLRAFVIVGFAALTWHDFKITRNLAMVLPVAWLCALGAIATLRRPSARAIAWAPLALLVPTSAWGVWQHRTTLADLSARVDCQPDPTVRETLAFMVKHAAGADQVWITGWVFRISPNLIDYWFRTHGVTARLKLDQQLFGEQTRTGADRSWNEQYRAYVDEKMLAEEVRERTTFITIETVPGTRYFDDWKAFGNNYARAMAEQTVLPEVDRIEFVDMGLLVRVYRAGGEPSAATLAARGAGASPADDVGISRVPGVDPLRRETFGGSARDWRVSPPEALAKIEVVREGSTLRVKVPSALPSLQVCNTTAPAPAPAFRALVHASATGVEGGRPFVHFRGMGEDGALQKLPDGKFDITHATLQADGPTQVEQDVALGPTSPQLRVCLMLDGVKGEVAMEDLAFYAPDAPRLTRATTSAGAGDAAAVALTPADDAGITLPAGTPSFREPFGRGTGGWRFFPPDAEGTMIEPGTSELAVQVAAPVGPLQACGPTFPYTGKAKAVVHARAEGVKGKAFVHLRGLDAQGVLVKDGDRGRIVHVGPLEGDTRLAETKELDLGEGVVTVRPCVVLENVAGRVVLEDLAVFPQ